MSRRLSACFVALACAVAGFASLGSTADATGTSASGLSAWKSCGDSLQCAVLRVPVDYAQPQGPTVDLAVARLRATDPSRRLGSLVFNFGGPGDAGTTTLPGFARDVPDAVRARYDLVSFDPRGSGISRPVECVGDLAAERLYAV